MVVAKKEDSLEDRFLEGQSFVSSKDSLTQGTSPLWFRQKTVPYNRGDGVTLLLTYDIYNCPSDPGKEIYQLRYQPGLISPF